MIERFKKNSLSIVIPFILVAGFLIQSGCTVKLISSYDETMDNAVTDLHKRVELFFLILESKEGLPECDYEYHKEFYTNAKVSISTIDIRARAIPDNEITIEQIGLLKENVELLEQLHKRRCLSKGQIEALRISFNSSFTSILKLELAKKRGD